MLRHLLAAAAIALVGMTGVAAADGLPGRTSRATAVGPYDWTGVYFGSHIGYGWDDVDLTENLSLTIGGLQPTGFPLHSSHSADGWLGGVHLGAMKQMMGPWVAGVELSLDGADINGTGSNCLGLT